MMTIILNNIVKNYQIDGVVHPVLKDINLTISKGDFVSIVGKSGSGKSTLLNMITLIDKPSSGEIIIEGTNLNKIKKSKEARWRGTTIGVVFQFFQLIPTLTLLENVMLPMDFCRMYSLSERKERAAYLLEQVDMIHHANKLPTFLSGGEQQRGAIARALATDPPIIAADEPTGSLDTQTAEKVFQIFEQLSKNGKTVVLITHDQDLAKKTNRSIVVSDGRIIREEFHSIQGETSIDSLV
jgi:putative ABC transport system ATP-binding protein